MRLLFIEDNAAFRNVVLREVLSGCEVVCAGTLLEARSSLGLAPFDAVLVDYDLPDGKGDAIISELLAAGLGGKIVAVSAFFREQRTASCGGASHAVRKAEFATIRAVLEGLVYPR
jgi:CheY-like chemotaxis protein